MEENLKRKIEKVTKNRGDVSLASLEATLDLSDKLDEVTQAIKAIPETVIPETIIPEYPSTLEISNLPEVQKVEITNLPEQKDDSEQVKLLQEILSEAKKKEEYTYDIEIDATLKEQLKGDKGEDGKDGVDGNKIEPQEIVTKLESLDGDERLDVSAVRGTEALIEDIAKKIAKEEVKKVKKTTIVSGGSSSSSGGLSESFETVSSNLSAYDSTLNYNGSGDITSIVYSNGVTKTFNYTGTDITSIVLSGSTPSGITLTKTLTYTDGDVTGVSYT